MSRFQPGQSGNPAGRPRGFRGVAKAIMAATRDGEELVEFALRVFRDTDAADDQRWQALVWLADRGLGKPLQSLELAASVDVERSPAYDLTGLSIDEQRALLDVLGRARALPEPEDSGD